MKTNIDKRGGKASMRRIGSALAAAAILSIPIGARATAYTATGSGNWGDPDKWTPTGFPNSPEDSASAPKSSVTMTLADVNTNDASFTVKSIGASTGSMNFTVNNVDDGVGKLIFDNPEGNASIYTVKNSKKRCDFNVGIVLNTNLSVKSLASVGARFTKEISSGADRTTGLIIASQTGTGSASSCTDVRINAAASYTGETHIQGSNVTGSKGSQSGGARLMLGIANALPIATVLHVEGATAPYYPQGGTLKLEGFNQEVAGLQGDAGYDPGKITTTTASTLTINNADDYDFAGNIGGATPTPVSLVKKGLGAQTLSGTNTYTGSTTVEAGTLVLAETGELRFVLEDNGLANAIVGDGTVQLNGLLRVGTNALTDVEGAWSLVETTTLTASFGTSFTLAFEDGTTFTRRPNGIYWSDGGWAFSTATGTLALNPPPPPTMIVVR
ncbi:MAG: autotransporter-associated beta strand repeat-containing protein [Kiritimatiellia bacterium]|jgi:autotransporter-associated beta strand protein